MAGANFEIISDESHRGVMAKALADELELLGFKRNVIICCGHNTAEQGVLKKKQNGGFLISVLDPQIMHEEFDYIFLPSHEPHQILPNIRLTHGFFTNISPSVLKGGERFDYLPKPIIGVLVGGRHVGGNFSVADAENLARSLNSKNASVVLTTSRRTEILVAQKFKEKLSRPNFIYDYNYDGQDNNPYLEILGVADEIIVSADSARMMCEAASSGVNTNIFFPQELHFSYKALAEDLIVNNYANNMKNFGNPTLLLAEAKRCANIIVSGK